MKLVNPDNKYHHQQDLFKRARNMHTHTHIHACTYTHMYLHTHTHIHARTHTDTERARTLYTICNTDISKLQTGA